MKDYILLLEPVVLSIIMAAEKNVCTVSSTLPVLQVYNV